MQSVTLNDASDVFVGTSEMPESSNPPTVLLWDDAGTWRAFKWLPNLGQSLPSPDPLIYREIPSIFVLDEVTP